MEVLFVSDEVLVCKHGLYKETCLMCAGMDDETVIREKQEALKTKNWHSNSFLDNSAHNSAFVEQEYDVDNAYDLDLDFEVESADE